MLCQIKKLRALKVGGSTFLKEIIEKRKIREYKVPFLRTFKVGFANGRSWYRLLVFYRSAVTFGPIVLNYYSIWSTYLCETVNHKYNKNRFLIY